MELMDLIFWVALILAVIGVLVGYPAERRAWWGGTVVCLIVDMIVVGLHVIKH